MNILNPIILTESFLSNCSTRYNRLHLQLQIQVTDLVSEFGQRKRNGICEKDDAAGSGKN